jgi:hypothetical protein
MHNGVASIEREPCIRKPSQRADEIRMLTELTQLLGGLRDTCTDGLVIWVHEQVSGNLVHTILKSDRLPHDATKLAKDIAGWSVARAEFFSTLPSLGAAGAAQVGRRCIDSALQAEQEVDSQGRHAVSGLAVDGSDIAVVPLVEDVCVLVVLDANVLVADPTFGGIVWRALAHAPTEWDVSVVVPRVALVEAQATLSRQSSDAFSGIQKAIETARRVGLPLPDAIAHFAKSAPDSVGSRLTERLSDLGVQVVDPPDAPHMDLVERAAQRRKPCDANGDGYRDTLIWLTVLELAKESDDGIALVTHNVKDFADLDAKPDDRLHPQLVAELDSIDAAEQVTLYRRLDDLVMALAAKYSTTEPSDLKEVGRELERTKVVDYLTSEVAPGLLGSAVKPSTCGLPRYVSAATVSAIRGLDDIEIVVTEPKGTESIARFTFTATFDLAAEVPPPESEATDEGTDPERSMEMITKALKVAGVLTRDSFHRPTSAEVTDIAAQQGDPGLSAWRTRRNATWPLLNPAFQSNLLKTIADAQRLSPLADPAWLRIQTDLQSNLLKTIADARRLPPLVDPAWLRTETDLQRIVGNIHNAPGVAGLRNIQKIIDGMQMGPAMRAITDAQKMISQSYLNPVITAALEVARQAEAARRAAEPGLDGEDPDGDGRSPMRDGGDGGDGDPDA